MTPPIQSLHARYCEITGFRIVLDWSRENAWGQWLAYGKRCGGWGEHELQMVVALIRKRIREQRRRPEALKFSNLIGNCDYFEEDLASAKAEARIPRKTERAKVLAAVGLSECKQSVARTPAQIMESDKAFAAFRDAMKKL